MLTPQSIREAAEKAGLKILSSEEWYQAAKRPDIKGPIPTPNFAKGAFHFDKAGVIKVVDTLMGDVYGLNFFFETGAFANYISVDGLAGYRKMENFKFPD